VNLIFHSVTSCMLSSY